LGLVVRLGGTVLTRFLILLLLSVVVRVGLCEGLVGLAVPAVVVLETTWLAVTILVLAQAGKGMVVVPVPNPLPNTAVAVAVALDRLVLTVPVPVVVTVATVLLHQLRVRQ
jgi:hypothetical protein